MTTQKKISIAPLIDARITLHHQALLRNLHLKGQDVSGAYATTDGSVVLLTDRDSIDDWDLDNDLDPSRPWDGRAYAYLYREDSRDPVDLPDVPYHFGDSLQDVLDRMDAGKLALRIPEDVVPRDIWGDEYNAGLIEEMFDRIRGYLVGFSYFTDDDEDDEEEDRGQPRPRRASAWQPERIGPCGNK